MIFQPSMRKILAARGYRHCRGDDEFTRHGNHARNIQYAFSKEFRRGGEKVVDIIFIAVDVVGEKLVIGFFRENLSIENGVLENSDVSIPLARFSVEEFERQLDRLIPKAGPLQGRKDTVETF